MLGYYFDQHVTCDENFLGLKAARTAGKKKRILSFLTDEFSTPATARVCDLGQATDFGHSTCPVTHASHGIDRNTSL